MNHQFFIWPVGVDERVTVNVSMQCDCECEKQEHRVSFYDRIINLKCIKIANL